MENTDKVAVVTVLPFLHGTGRDSTSVASLLQETLAFVLHSEWPDTGRQDAGIAGRSDAAGRM